MRPFVESVLGGEYDIKTSRPPATVLDIGANIGAFTAWAKTKWPSAQVIAYEPVASSSDMFAENLNGTPGVLLNRMGVRNYNGCATIYGGITNIGEASYFKDYDAKDPIGDASFIDAATIPSYEFVKIDAEGCEAEIIEKLDLSATRWIALEIHNKDFIEPIERKLLAHGFYRDTNRALAQNRWLLKFTKEITRKLFVAVPVYREIPAEVVMSLLAIPKCKFEFPVEMKMNAGDSLVTRSRNNLTAEFLESDCSDLLFLDCDLIFRPDQIARLMHWDEDIVAGFYARKRADKLMWVANRFPDTEEMQADSRGLVQVRYAGTGFMRVRRNVFDRMLAEYGSQIEYKPDSGPRDKEWDFWKVGIYRGDGFPRYLSEDWYFCQLANDLGYKVMMDTGIMAKHIGSITYPLKHLFPHD